MSQIAITGGMRSGKTYYAVFLIMQAIEKGRIVVTNVPVNIVDCPYLYQWDWDCLLNPDYDKTKYPYLDMGGVLFVLDECYKGLPSSNRTISSNAFLMSFFREHGKRIDKNGISNDIILITQDLKSINTAIRDVCEQTILCSKPIGVGFKGATIRYFMSGSVNGLKPVKSLITKTERAFLNPAIYTCYNSHDGGNSDNKGNGSFKNEGTVLKDATVFHSFQFRAAIVFIIAAFSYVFYNVNNAINQHTQSIVPSASAATSPTKEQKHETTDKNPDTAIDAVRTGMGNDGLSRVDETKRQGSRSDTNSGLFNPMAFDSAVLLDKNWRLASVIQNQSTGEIFINAVDAKGHLQRIHERYCVLGDFNKFTCHYQGKLITDNSGSYLSHDGGFMGASK